MSNFRFNFLFGFLSSGPVKYSPSPVYSMICPTEDTYDHVTGMMTVAPLGLRRIQSSLRRSGVDVVAQHPFAVEQAVGPGTELVGLSEMSPLGMGPVDSALSWTNTGWNREWFLRLAHKLKKLKEKFRFKTVVGGAGSWQLLERSSTGYSLLNSRIDPGIKKQLGIDHVVDGEADRLAPDVLESVASGKAPEVIRVLTNSIKDTSDIPEITEPTLTSIVECMRGCGRGCDFCAPNLRSKRDFPPERVAREASVNIRRGYTSVWLQTEELTLYGCEDKDKWPNEDAILELYSALKSAGADKISATHWTFAGVRAAPDLIRKLHEMNGLNKGGWLGVQPGLEYASPRLVKRFMPYKVKPFTPEEYPETIREGLRIMNLYHYYPACTLIIGHPEEEPGEVAMTTELIKTLSLRDRVHGLFAPLLYVDYYRPGRTMTFDRMNQEQWKLFYACWKHNVRELREKTWVATQSFGPAERLISTLGAHALGWNILHFLKRRFRQLFGYVPDWAN